MQITAEEIEAKKTPAGAWTKSQLAEWGVSWPPQKGWKERLINGEPEVKYQPEPVSDDVEEMAKCLVLAEDDDPERLVGSAELPLWRSYTRYAQISLKAQSIFLSRKTTQHHNANSF